MTNLGSDAGGLDWTQYPITGLTVSHDVPINAVTYTAPNGEQFYAPPEANWSDVYDAGKDNGLNPISGNQAIGHFGTFDFQRSTEGFFIAPYTNASNFAVGVYMNGAGFSLPQTILLGNPFAATMSSNSASSMVKWWTNGWNAANSGTLPKKNP
jgi:hypothetical protein